MLSVGSVASRHVFLREDGMSLLFPLFLLAGGAVVAPIVLHLLRQRAKHTLPFSSLMFLRQTPPRMQPKARVEHLPLLLLRCSALLLLALAFARPWWDNEALVPTDAGGRTVILLDTSASMARGDLWTQALAQVESEVAQLGAGQRVALATFDRAVKPLVDFADWSTQVPTSRAEILRQRMQSARPGFAGTDLGQALSAALDLIRDDETAAGAVHGPTRIVVAGDVQGGRPLDALRATTWPANVQVVLRGVVPAQVGNAGLALVQPAEGEAPEAGDQRLRIRVLNDAASTAQAFTLRWGDGVGTPVPVSVPPGSSRVVRAPARPAPGPAPLVLEGDDQPFDNTLFVTADAPAPVRVAWVGTDRLDDPQGLGFFLARALQPTRAVAPVVEAVTTPAQITGSGWVVVGGTPAAAISASLKTHLDHGGSVFAVLTKADDIAWLSQITGQTMTAQEATSDGFALIARVDFTHPLLQAFDGAQVGDFSKIHVWHHRRVEPPGIARVLASYDDGSPVWFELPVGSGRVLIATSGWQPSDSQFALSTKFVPFLYTELQRSARVAPRRAQVLIGDAATYPADATAVRGPLAADGKPADGSAPDAGAGRFARPGLYQVDTTGGTLVVAANVDPAESHTAPLPLESLEALGVQLARPGVDAAAALAATQANERLLKVAEVEQRQRWWMWILAAVLVLLVVETVIAARVSLAARTPAESSAAAAPASATTGATP